MTNNTFSGKRIVITRPRGQSKDLQRTIEDSGAVCVVIPLIEIAQPDDEGFAFEQAMRNLSDYEWVVCTSANGASRVAPYLSHSASGPRLAAVGVRLVAGRGHTVLDEGVGNPVPLMRRHLRQRSVLQVLVDLFVLLLM